MQSSRVFLILATVAIVLLSVAAAQSQSQSQSQSQQQHQQYSPEKSGGSKVTRREYPYDNSWWAIGLILVPLLILLCFPLFSTPYGHGHGHGHHHGGWGYGRSASEKLISPEVQERVLKSVEG